MRRLMRVAVWLEYLRRHWSTRIDQTSWGLAPATIISFVVARFPFGV